jgi:Rad3-related DNA helicase
VDGKLYVYIADLAGYTYSRIERFRSVIFLSATFPPLKVFTSSLGLDRCGDRLLVIRYPYTPHIGGVRLNVVTGLSTRYSLRSATLYEAMARIITGLSRRHGGSLVVFAASEEVARGLERVLRAMAGGETPPLLSQRGRMREGIDIDCEAVVIAGFSHPKPDKESEVRYSAIHGRGLGAFTLRDIYYVSGIIAAIQSIGRIMRGGRGEIHVYLLDERFASKKYMSFLPPWFRGRYRVVSADRLLAELSTGENN